MDVKYLQSRIYTVWLFLNTLCNPRNVPAQKQPPFLSLDIPQNML